MHVHNIIIIISLIASTPQIRILETPLIPHMLLVERLTLTGSIFFQECRISNLTGCDAVEVVEVVEIVEVEVI